MESSSFDFINREIKDYSEYELVDINLGGAVSKTSLIIDEKYRLTPLFDNGSSLLPKLSEEEIGKCLDKSKNEVSRYITDLPKSQIRSSKNKRYNYIQLIKDICELGYRDRVLEILSRITETDIISVFSDKYLSSFIRQDKLEVLKTVIIKRYRLLKEELDCR